MKAFTEFSKAKDVTGFVNKLFEARQQAHAMHLKTGSYAAHKALDEFYSAILDLADKFIETYQGQYKLIKQESVQVDDSLEPLKYVKEFAAFLKQSSDLFKADTHLQNIVDEMTALSFQTIYKLQYLK